MASVIPVAAKNRAVTFFDEKTLPSGTRDAVFSNRGARSFPSPRNKLIQAHVLSLYAKQMRTTKCGLSE
jgi:hypothetical protein